MRRLLEALKVMLVCVVVGGLTGALINVLDGTISPDYFRAFFNGKGVFPRSTGELYVATIGQGTLEGLCYGTVMGLIFSATVAWGTNGGCPVRFTLPYIGKMAAVTLGFWFIGGLDGALLAYFRPQAFGLVPGPAPLSAHDIRYFFVGSAIYGTYVGCLISLMLGCAWFRRDWRRLEMKEKQL